MLSITKINCLNFEDFTEHLNNVIEHCPVLSAALWKQKPFDSVSHMVSEMAKIVSALPLSVKEGILRVHPDLAGRHAEAGQLTSESTGEQSSANLNLMTCEEKDKMKTLNQKYKDKFGFPFVICARLNKKEAILRGLELRCYNSLKVETLTGIEEVMKICELRMRDLVIDESGYSRL